MNDIQQVDIRITGMPTEACPLQVTGMVDGYPFYFRARYGHWTFVLVEDVNADPSGMTACDGDGCFQHGDTFGDGEWDGSMSYKELSACIWRSVCIYYAEKVRNGNS